MGPTTLTGDLPVSVGYANYQPCLSDLAALRAFCEAIEELGYAGVQCQDHLAYPWDPDAYHYAAGGQMAHHPGQPVIEAMTFLAAAASCSRALTLETSLIVLPQRHPLELAKQAAAIDQLSGGRLLLGVGPGWLRAEMAALGWDPATRGQRMDEALEILTRAFDEPRVSAAGEHFQFDAVSLEPRPERPATDLLWIGGGEAGGFDAAVTRLGRYGSGWLVNPRLPFERIAEGLERARQVAAAHDRGEVDFGVDLIVHTGEDLARLPAAVDRRRQAGATRLTVMLGGLEPAGSVDELIRRANDVADAVRSA